METLLTTLNSMSPLGIIALLGLVLFMQAKNHRTTQTIQSNDLHELPEIATNIRAMTETLQRIEVNQGENFSYIKARLNGRH